MKSKSICLTKGEEGKQGHEKELEREPKCQCLGVTIEESGGVCLLLTASKGRVGLHGTNFCQKKTTNKVNYGGRLESTQRRERRGER